MVVEIAPGAAGVPGVPRTGRQAGCEAATAVRREVLDDALAKKPAKVRRAAGRQAVAVKVREGRGCRGAGGGRTCGGGGGRSSATGAVTAEAWPILHSPPALNTCSSIAFATQHRSIWSKVVVIIVEVPSSPEFASL